MKRIFAIALAAEIMLTQQIAFAEFSFKDYADAAMAKHSMAQEFDTSKLKSDGNGKYIFCDEDNAEHSEVPVDIAKSFRVSYYFNVYSKEEVQGYNGEDFLDFFEEYKNKRSYTYVYPDDTAIKDISYDIDSEEYGYNVWYEVCTIGNADNLKARYENVLKVLDESGAEKINDAYEFHFTSYVPYSKRSDGTIRTKRCYSKAFFFSTDKGEFVIPYKAVTDGTIKPEENVLYAPSEFLEKITAIYDEIKPIESGYESSIIIDVDGEEHEEIRTVSPVAPEDLDKLKEKDSEKEETNNQPEQDVKNQDDKEDTKDNNEEEPETEPETKTEEPPVKTPEETSANKDGLDVKINGSEIVFTDQQPIIKNNRVLVPMRKIFEELGAEVSWDEASQTVKASKDGTVISLQIGKNEITKNGVISVLDTEAQILNDRTLVPIRAISESFGNEVTWNAETKTVEIK